MIQNTFRLPGSFIIYLVLLCLITGCSSPLRVLDYWTSNDFKEYEGMNFLVVCNAKTPSTGIEFEIHIAEKLQKKNINADASYKIIPSLALARSIEEIRGNRDSIKNSGYNGLIFTSVKNIIESYKTGESMPDRAIQNPDPSVLSTTYVIEALVFDLNRSGGDELVGVNLVAVTDPTSAEEMFKAYSRIVGRHFKNKSRQ
ncbi:MAG: hypothetical protein ACR2MM_04925 [Flavobacteriaceae bacterium]